MSSAAWGSCPRWSRGVWNLIAEGADSAGRTLADLDVWFTCFWFVDAEPGAALAEGAWAATAFALHFAQGRVDGKFVPEEYRDGIVRLGEQYDLVAHGRVSESLKRIYVERADELGIGGYIRSRFMFCGTPPEVESQIRAAMAAGAPQLRRRHRRRPPRAPPTHRRLGRAGAASLRPRG